MIAKLKKEELLVNKEKSGSFSIYSETSWRWYRSAGLALSSCRNECKWAVLQTWAQAKVEDKEDLEHKEDQGLTGPECVNTLFAHAILGCNMTSRTHGIGKGVALTKIRTDALFREQANVFNHPGASKDEVIMAREKALLCLYNCRADKSLDSLGYTKFCKKVAPGTTLVQPESLPPTSVAIGYTVSEYTLQFSSRKVYRLGLEVDGWKTISNYNGPATSTWIPPRNG